MKSGRAVRENSSPEAATRSTASVRGTVSTWEEPAHLEGELAASHAAEAKGGGARLIYHDMGRRSCQPRSFAPCRNVEQCTTAPPEEPFVAGLNDGVIWNGTPVVENELAMLAAEKGKKEDLGAQRVTQTVAMGEEEL